MPWRDNEERRQAIKTYVQRVDEVSLLLKWIGSDMDDDGFDWLAERIDEVIASLGSWSKKDFERNYERL